MPHLHRDWARFPATSAPGLGLGFLRHLHRNLSMLSATEDSLERTRLSRAPLPRQARAAAANDRKQTNKWRRKQTSKHAPEQIYKRPNRPAGESSDERCANKQTAKHRPRSGTRRWASERRSGTCQHSPHTHGPDSFPARMRTLTQPLTRSHTHTTHTHARARRDRTRPAADDASYSRGNS